MQPQGSRIAARIAIGYAFAGVLWIVVSDLIVKFHTDESPDAARMQMLKGFAFVVTTASLLYWLLRRELERWQSEFQARRRAEEAYLTSEAIFSTGFRSSPVAMYVLDAESRVLVDCNPQFERLTGYSLNDIRDRTIAQLKPGRANCLPEPEVGRLESGGSVREVEAGLETKSGEQRHVLYSAELLKIGARRVLLVLMLDITQRKLNEEMLRQSEQRYRSLVELSPDAVFVNEDDKVTFVNRAGVALWRAKSADEILGRNVSELFHPSFQRFIDERVANLHDSGEPSPRIEEQIVAFDGSNISVEVAASRLQGSGSRRIQVICRDISVRKSAEVEIANRLRTEERLSKFIATAPGVAYTYKRFPDGRRCFPFASEAMYEILGVRPDELRENTVALRDRIHPDDFVTAFLESDRSRITLTPWRAEFRVFHPTRGLLWIEGLSSPSLEADGSTVWHGFLHDVTERRRADSALRESEARFRQLAENIEQVFWITNPEKTEIQYVSPAYEKIFGRSIAALSESPHAWVDTIHPDDRERVANAAFADGSAEQFNVEYRIVRPDGAERWIHDRSFPVRGPEGELLRIVGIAEDITDRRRLEEQVRMAQRMEGIGQLAAGVAHDFNNILGAILGNITLARLDTPADSPAVVALDHIHQASIRAKNLVLQILAFARQTKPEKRVVDLKQCVQESVRLLRASLPAGIEIVTNVADQDARVLADLAQIEQVIINLGTNAWHAHENTPGRITVGLQSVQLTDNMPQSHPDLLPGRYVELSIADTGSGIPPNVIGRIFEPFFTTKAQGHGTGLGLAVVHGIVKDHMGTVLVSSEPSRGSIFRILLPIVEQPLSKPPVLSSLPPEPGAGERILYLDDEEALVHIAVRGLERLGYAVSGFSEPGAALQAFREHPHHFDLVVTDLNMPGISGLQIAREMLSVRGDVAIVLSSGYITDELNDEAARVGVRCVLHKPNTITELCRTITEIIRQKGDGHHVTDLDRR